MSWFVPADPTTHRRGVKPPNAWTLFSRRLRYRQMGGTYLGRGDIAMTLEQPVPVEPVLELEQRLPELLDGVEGPHPQKLLLQGTDESLGHPVALRRPDKTRARLDAEKGDLAWKAWLMYCGPWSCRNTRPSAIS